MKQYSLQLPTGRLPGMCARFVATFGLIAGSTSALAQEVVGTLQYGPPGGGGPGALSPTAIPAMGGTGLVLLSALFLFVFWRIHRRSTVQNGRLMAVALVSGALASGMGGVKLVSDAMAQAGMFRDMTNPSGGTLDFGIQSGLTGCVRNATEVDLEVLAMEGQLFGHPVNIEPECEINHDPAPHDNPGCQVGLVLAPNEICGAFTGFNASDVRLKTDISRVGSHETGLTLYEFRYIGGTTRYRGVMAQEVLGHTPEAVLVMPNGHLAVNYELLGLEMTQVR